jgi:hypothetical protein
MGGGPFIIPQMIFDTAQISASGVGQPNAIQDSGAVVLAVGPGWTQIFAATVADSLYVNVLMIGAAVGANECEIGFGPLGFEALFTGCHIPSDAANFGWTICRAPLRIPAGTRITGRTSLLPLTLEFHLYYRV